MASWEAFSQANPELAAFGRQRISGRVAYLATTRADGGPRIHPVAPFFGPAQLLVYMDPGSPKCKDLQRDPRYALHCSVEDRNGGEGEFYIRGQARVVDDAARRAEFFALARAIGFSPQERYVIFELQVDSAYAVSYEEDRTVRAHWRADSATR